MKYATAEFHREMFRLTEAADPKNFFLVAFRGSGKSTIMTMSYPIWAILGEQQKKFVLILTQTKGQAKLHMMNLRREFEGNALLKNDLGPFQEETDEWGSSSIVFSRSGARITVASVEQSIRGVRHKEHRPDLIICDDVEDLSSVRTREGRDRTHQWLVSEVIPAGDRGTRLVVVGNLLHEDSLMARLKRDVAEGKVRAVFKEFPLVSDDSVIAWPGKYPSWEYIEEEKSRAGNDSAWFREYLLKIISDTARVIHPDWIQFYDELPGHENKNYRHTWLSVDLAISEKETADCTAMIGAHIYGHADKLKIYILPNMVNTRLSFPETYQHIKIKAKAIGKEHPAHIVIEDVAYQKAMIQSLNMDGYKVDGFKPVGDKRARLALTSEAIKRGQVLFPRQGAEELIFQLIGFGVEHHDDLADAFSMIVLKALEENRREAQIFVLSGPSYPPLGSRGLFGGWN